MPVEMAKCWWLLKIEKYNQMRERVAKAAVQFALIIKLLEFSSSYTVQQALRVKWRVFGIFVVFCELQVVAG